MLIAAIILGVTVNAGQLDSRVTDLTCTLARCYSEGRMDAEMYVLVSDVRNRAARAVTRFLHSGRGGDEAMRAMLELENVMRGVE